MIDIGELLSRLYKLDAQRDSTAALDLVVEFFWDAAEQGDYRSMDIFYEKVDLSKITIGSVIVCPVMSSFKYISKVQNHIPYCEKAIERYRELGLEEDRIHDIMDRYFTVGNYWENMATLGAPEWLTGKKPE